MHELVFASQHSVLSQAKSYLMLWYRPEVSSRVISTLWMSVVAPSGGTRNRGDTVTTTAYSGNVLKNAAP